MSCTLWDQAPFRAAVGSEFRPGGLGITEELVRHCSLRSGERVLDLGCGVGSTASFLNRRGELRVFGLDSSAHSLEEARIRDPGVTWVLGDAREIPYSEGYFGAVFAECFLSTQDDPARVLEEIRRVLRPGGRLAVSDMYVRRPGAAPPSESLSSGACLRGASGRDALFALMEGAGFAVRTWRDRSDALRAFVASVVLEYGSVAALWEAAGMDEGLRESILAARPGYYLLVAESIGPASHAVAEVRV